MNNGNSEKLVGKELNDFKEVKIGCKIEELYKARKTYRVFPFYFKQPSKRHFKITENCRNCNETLKIRISSNASVFAYYLTGQFCYCT